MSAMAVGGRRYAAGLYWLARGGPRATARASRRLGRPWCVHHGERTGFAADDMGQGPEGLPALALALKAHIDGEFWMALVEDDSEARCALVKARGGAVLADGDEVFGDRAAALAAFERARGLGWSLHATPGLAAELGDTGVALLHAAALGEAASAAGAAIVLAPAAPAARGGRRLVPALLSLAVLAGMAGGLVRARGVVQVACGTGPGTCARGARAGADGRGRHRRGGADQRLPAGADRQPTLPAGLGGRGHRLPGPLRRHGADGAPPRARGSGGAAGALAASGGAWASAAAAAGGGPSRALARGFGFGRAGLGGRTAGPGAAGGRRGRRPRFWR